jgi:flagellar hook-length control protein FliK
MNKTAFVISIALTTFVLIAVAGIAYAVDAQQKAQAAELQAAVSAPIPTAADPTTQAGLDPAVEQAISQREAAYQALITQANARLEQSQQQQQALQEQLNTLKAASQSAAASQTTASQPVLTPEQAVSIASNFLQQTSVYSVETVTLQGASVYMVTFSSGDVIYVGMDGQIVGSVSGQQNAQVSRKVVIVGGGGEHDDHEHEGGGDD